MSNRTHSSSELLDSLLLGKQLFFPHQKAIIYLITNWAVKIPSKTNALLSLYLEHIFFPCLLGICSFCPFSFYGRILSLCFACFSSYSVQTEGTTWVRGLEQALELKRRGSTWATQMLEGQVAPEVWRRWLPDWEVIWVTCSVVAVGTLLLCRAEGWCLDPRVIE